jgi:hypothetical protein
VLAAVPGDIDEADEMLIIICCDVDKASGQDVFEVDGLSVAPSRSPKPVQGRVGRKRIGAQCNQLKSRMWIIRYIMPPTPSTLTNMNFSDIVADAAGSKWNSPRPFSVKDI